MSVIKKLQKVTDEMSKRAPPPSGEFDGYNVEEVLSELVFGGEDNGALWLRLQEFRNGQELLHVFEDILKNYGIECVDEEYNSNPAKHGSPPSEKHGNS